MWWCTYKKSRLIAFFAGPSLNPLVIAHVALIIIARRLELLRCYTHVHIVLAFMVRESEMDVWEYKEKFGSSRSSYIMSGSVGK